MVYFHKLTHTCHCCLEMGSVYARPDFLLLRWDCRKTEKCRREGVNSACRGDIRLLSVYCVLLTHPFTAHGALSDSLIVLSHQLETSEQNNYLSFAVTQRASQQPRFAPAARGQRPYRHCLTVRARHTACSLVLKMPPPSFYVRVEPVSVFETFDVSIFKNILNIK